MGTHKCEGTYVITDGQVAYGSGYSDVSGDAAKTDAENSARASADRDGAKLANAETCEAPCENPPWYRVTKVLIDSSSEENTQPLTGKKWWSGSAAVLWLVEISCRKARPPDEPVTPREGGAYYTRLPGSVDEPSLLRAMNLHIRSAGHRTDGGSPFVVPPVDLSLIRAGRPRTKPNLDTVIAYLSHSSGTLFVAADHRLEVARKWGVDAPHEAVWFIPRRGYSVDVEEVPGFVGQAASEDREGDERIRKGFRCGTNHAEAHKACSFDSPTSYDLLGYSECTRGEVGDTCDEVYVKIGQTHEWNPTCENAWADLDVYRWVCLP